MGTGAFKPLTQVEQIFKAMVWDPMIKAGEIWLETAVPVIDPIIDFPVIKELDEFAIQKITDSLFNFFVLLVDMTAIKLIDPIMQSAYESSSEALVVISIEKGNTSDEYKKAEAKAIVDFSSFVRMHIVS